MKGPTTAGARRLAEQWPASQPRQPGLAPSRALYAAMPGAGACTLQAACLAATALGMPACTPAGLTRPGAPPRVAPPPLQDLQCLGRDLGHTIIVDNSPHSYMFQPENALPIGTFIDDMQDQVGGGAGRQAGQGCAAAFSKWAPRRCSSSKRGKRGRSFE